MLILCFFRLNRCVIKLISFVFYILFVFLFYNITLLIASIQQNYNNN